MRKVSLVAQFGEGGGGLALSAHMDTVPSRRLCNHVHAGGFGDEEGRGVRRLAAEFAKIEIQRRETQER